jgi:hypothetical protein
MRKYVHFSHFSLSSNPALRMICTWLDTDDCGIPRMSASSQTQSASFVTKFTIRERVGSAKAREKVTRSLMTIMIVTENFVMTNQIFAVDGTSSETQP